MKCTAAGGSGAREELFTAAATAALTPPRGSLAARGIGAASNVPIPPDTRDFRQNGTGANFPNGVFGKPSSAGFPIRRQLPSQYNAKDLRLTMDLIHPSGQDPSLPNNQQYCEVILAKAYSKGSLNTNGVQLGIGIAAGVAALIAIVVAIFLWRRHRQGGRCGGKYSYSYSAINNGDNV